MSSFSVRCTREPLPVRIADWLDTVMLPAHGLIKLILRHRLRLFRFVEIGLIKIGFKIVRRCASCRDSRLCDWFTDIDQYTLNGIRFGEEQRSLIRHRNRDKPAERLHKSLQSTSPKGMRHRKASWIQSPIGLHRQPALDRLRRLHHPWAAWRRPSRLGVMERSAPGRHDSDADACAVAVSVQRTYPRTPWV